jgi:hypothetical protein
MGSHFFWNAGTSMQKSQPGLLQTMLYQAFRQCPDLLKEACPARWTDEIEPEPWSLDEPFETFDRLSKKLRSSRFCFFIDGLDEYSGNHQELVNLIKSISTSTSMKFCVSSRPWNVFEHAFGKNP